MAYSINPNLVKARALAMRMLISDVLPLQVVANHCGVHRSTIWRWKRKWLAINRDIQFSNVNRPNRKAGQQFRLTSCHWTIPTLSSRPRTSPRAVSAWIIDKVLELRHSLRRCAEVIWHHLVQDESICISLSSVRRILKRYGAINGRRKRVRFDNPRRPVATQPGELVQTDTIHYVCPLTYKRRYVYTVIDLYSRMAYAEVHSRIRPGIAASVIAHASKTLGFEFLMVQADNGLEFSRYFEQTLAGRGISTRHSRLGRPNDNAHIERFNRTLQEECLGSYLTPKTSNVQVQVKLNRYLDFYNTRRVHLGLQLRTPVSMLQRS